MVHLVFIVGICVGIYSEKFANGGAQIFLIGFVNIYVSLLPEFDLVNISVTLVDIFGIRARVFDFLHDLEWLVDRPQQKD
jgi:hypothetical protein